MFGLSHRTLQAMRRRKTIAEAQQQGGGSSSSSDGLSRSLTAFDLVLYGVGSSVGAGIFALVGIGEKIAGPAISVSFLGCGFACILTSLAYAEFASRIPVAGSAYSYVYIAFGEFCAWIVGWNLILGYGFSASVTARAWGDYTGAAILKLLPSSTPPFVFAIVQNLTECSPARILSYVFGSEDKSPSSMLDNNATSTYTISPLSTIIILLSSLVLVRGAKDSSSFNNIMTLANISFLALVVVSGILSGSVSSDNFTPFAPNEFHGILQGAGLVFFSFIGFDLTASLSEEVINPELNMPIGIVGSLLASTIIYIAVSLAVVGMAPFEFLGETVPIVNALLANACCTHSEQIEKLETASQEEDFLAVQECLLNCQEYTKPYLATISQVIGGGANFGLMASCFTCLMGQPRIFYRMAKDGLWFELFAKVHPITKVPTEGIKITGFAAALLACFVPLEDLADFISLGTLMVFTFVNAGVILLRLRGKQNIMNPIPIHLQESGQDEQNYHRGNGKRMFENHKENTILILLLIYAGAVTAFVVLLFNVNAKLLAVLCFVVALSTASAIVNFPNVSWTENSASNSAKDCYDGAAPNTVKTTTVEQLERRSKFSCPCVPVIPLSGIACNCVMMGSLPLSSWVLCTIWISCGVVVYFVYGIHNSKVGHKDFGALPRIPSTPDELDEAETTPLMVSSISLNRINDYETSVSESYSAVQSQSS